MKEAAKRGRPYFLLAGLRKKACKIGYKIPNPMILLFLRDFRAARRRNFLGEISIGCSSLCSKRLQITFDLHGSSTLIDWAASMIRLT